MAVAVQTDPSFVAGAPDLIFPSVYFVASYAPGRNYDISPDGQRFLMIKEGAPVDVTDPFAGLTRIHVVLNWAEELKRPVPTYPAK